MTNEKQYKLYRVTFTDGATRTIRASSMLMAGTQSTASDGSDISHVEPLAVDVPYNGKDARKVARLTGVSTRHMAAFPCKVLARHVLTQSTLRIKTAGNGCIVFHCGVEV